MSVLKTHRKWGYVRHVRYVKMKSHALEAKAQSHVGTWAGKARMLARHVI